MNSNKLTHTSCPFLGLSYDKATYSNFPSIDNVCYHGQPNNSPTFSHQHEFCFTKKYVECPVYSSPEGTKLPESLQLIVNNKPHKQWILLILGFIVIGAAILLGIHWKNKIQSSEIPSQTPTYSQAIATLAVFIKNTATTTPSNTPTEVIPSVTPTPQITATVFTSTPSFTATELLAFGLESIIGENPQFIIHRTLEGESLPLYANIYQTSVEAIRAVNFGLPRILWTGQIVIIPINQTDMAGIPPFSAYEIVDDGITFEKIAEEFSVPIEELLRYNASTQEYTLRKGDWILIPQTGN